MSLRGSPMLMKNDGGASFSLQRRLQPTVFALTEFRRMCGEAWAVLQGSGFFTPAQCAAEAFTRSLVSSLVERIKSARSASYHTPFFRNLTKTPVLSASSVNRCLGPGRTEIRFSI